MWHRKLKNTSGWRFYFAHVVHTQPAVLNQSWSAFYIYLKWTLNILRVLLARCHHGLCSDIVERPLRNIKHDRHLVPTGSFCCCPVCWWCQGRVHKKMPMTSQRKAIVDNFCRGRQYDWLEDQEGWRLSATKMNCEKPPPGGGSYGWVRNIPKIICLCINFWPRNKGKGGKVVKVGIVIPVGSSGNYMGSF